MLTPQQKKARELVEKMSSQTYSYQPYAGARYNVDEIGLEAGKKCALIAVDEIILSAPFEPVDTDWDEAGSSAQYWYPQKLEDSAKWWAEVKEEINKL
jgi:hypothetical protein